MVFLLWSFKYLYCVVWLHVVSKLSKQLLISWRQAKQHSSGTKTTAFSLRLFSSYAISSLIHFITLLLSWQQPSIISKNTIIILVIFKTFTLSLSSAREAITIVNFKSPKEFFWLSQENYNCNFQPAVILQHHNGVPNKNPIPCQQSVCKETTQKTATFVDAKKIKESVAYSTNKQL